MKRYGIVLYSVLLLCLVLGAGLGIRAPERALASSPAPAAQADLRGFHLLNSGDGWLWSGERLYWTRDAGRHWVNITPPNFERAAIRGVFFGDARQGWLVGLRPNGAGSPTWVLARTPDAGRSWQITSLSLLAPDEAEVMSGAVSLDFVDLQHGWIVVQRTTSSAFSEGALFQTTDGGQTWARLQLPGGNPVYFATPSIGWTTGGPGSDQLYRSTDGGRSWSRQFVGAEMAAPGRRLRYRLPTFDNPRDGVLPVITNDGSEIRVDTYATDDGGQSWQSGVSVPFEAAEASGTHVTLSVLNSRRWLLASPSDARMLDIANRREITARLNTDGRAAGIAALDMATAEIGWAERRTGNCERSAEGQKRCAQEAGLLRTTDGGRTWASVDLPAGPASQSPQTPAQTQVAIGQGFDACYPGSAAEMQTWFASSPYTVVNLYIGGSSLYSGCTPLTPTYVNQLALQGWTFVPTWVGPQAPCTTYRTLFPYDVALAQAQGISEANAAIDSAAALGLTLPDQSATIIYYDLEAFPSGNAPCRDAAKAFVSGWTAQLHTRANKAGVYAIYTVLSDYSVPPNAPDDIWIAQWVQPFVYSPTASVWNVPNITNTIWVNHQRLHQYTGGHDENWGGVILNIDSDVLDARVAALPCYTLSASTGISGGVASIPSAPNCVDRYFANSSVQVQATPDDGFLFTGWSGDADGLTSPLTVYMDGDKNLVANFAAIQSRIYIPTVLGAPP